MYNDVCDCGFSIIDIHFEIDIASVYLDQKSSPVCSDFDITVLLDNNQHGGSIPVDIDVQAKLKKCEKNLDEADVDLMHNSESEFIPLDLSVIIIVFLSCGTYIRSLIKSYLLAKVSVCLSVCLSVCVCIYVYVCVCMCACMCM